MRYLMTISTNGIALWAKEDGTRVAKFDQASESATIDEWEVSFVKHMIGPSTLFCHYGGDKLRPECRKTFYVGKSGGTLYLSLKKKTATADYVEGDLSMFLLEEYGINKVIDADANRVFRSETWTPNNIICDLVDVWSDGTILGRDHKSGWVPKNPNEIDPWSGDDCKFKDASWVMARYFYEDPATHGIRYYTLFYSKGISHEEVSLIAQSVLKHPDDLESGLMHASW